MAILISAVEAFRGDRRQTCRRSRLLGLRAIETEKQVSDRVPHAQRQQAPPLMLLMIVKHMATLAERLQIAHPVIGGIVFEMRSRQHDLGCADSAVADSSKAGQGPSASIAPGLFLFVPPSTIA